MKKKMSMRSKLLAATVLSVLTANTAFAADVGVVPGGPFKTDTTVTPAGENTWKVETTTIIKPRF